MSAIRYLFEQAVNFLDTQKFRISGFHVAATEFGPKHIYQLNIIKKLLQTKFTGISWKY
jgi:hypothetical protein